MERLYGAYFSRVRGLIADMMLDADADLIEETINETMLEVWRASGRVDSRTSIPVWIMGLAVLRAQQNADARLAKAVPVESQWQRLLRPLSLPQRAVIHLVCTGYGRQEIAAVLQISLAAMDSILLSARSRIRRDAGSPP